VLLEKISVLKNGVAEHLNWIVHKTVR